MTTPRNMPPAFSASTKVANTPAVSVEAAPFSATPKRVNIYPSLDDLDAEQDTDEPTDSTEPGEISPEDAAAYADESWLLDLENSGQLEAYRGEFVAACNQQILGHGKDTTKLREQIVAELGIDPNRIVMRFVVKHWR